MPHVRKGLNHWLKHQKGKSCLPRAFKGYWAPIERCRLNRSMCATHWGIQTCWVTLKFLITERVVATHWNLSEPSNVRKASSWSYSGEELTSQSLKVEIQLFNPSKGKSQLLNQWKVKSQLLNHSSGRSELLNHWKGRSQLLNHSEKRSQLLNHSNGTSKESTSQSVKGEESTSQSFKEVESTSQSFREEEPTSQSLKWDFKGVNFSISERRRANFSIFHRGRLNLSIIQRGGANFSIIRWGGGGSKREEPSIGIVKGREFIPWVLSWESFIQLFSMKNWLLQFLNFKQNSCKLLYVTRTKQYVGNYFLLGFCW